jgi:CubicO group peptidase (beta-lactamase class C family)
MFMNVRQMAKLGQLYLQNGDPEDGGEPLISSDWVSQSLTSMVPMGIWRLVSDGRFYAEGLFGQYVMVIPSRNIVIATLRLDAEDTNSEACVYR